MPNEALPNRLSNEAVPNVLVGLPPPPQVIKTRRRVPSGIAVITLAGVIALVLAVLRDVL